MEIGSTSLKSVENLIELKDTEEFTEVNLNSKTLKSCEKLKTISDEGET